jgi:L-lactate dehydrogenase complex protein LldF
MNDSNQTANSTGYGPPNAFDQNALRALGDEQLHSALQNLVNTFGKRREQAIGTVDDWEGLRERARAIKDETLLHLDRYLQEFADNANRRLVRR